jgi:hypothetical protein
LLHERQHLEKHRHLYDGGDWRVPRPRPDTGRRRRVGSRHPAHTSSGDWPDYCDHGYCHCLFRHHEIGVRRNSDLEWYFIQYYWTSFEHRSYKRFPASLIGALVGLGMAYMFVALPPVIGLAAVGGVTLAVIVVAVYCLLMSWLPLFVNMSAMLFLTVAGAPPVLHHADFPGAFLALIIGAFFVLLVFKVADWLLERFGNKASAANDKS